MSSLENVRVFTQSAIRIEGAAGTVIYFDPFSLTDAEAARDADFVLITHAHYDHLSPEDYARVASEKTVVVAPASMAEEVRGLSCAGTHLLRAGEKVVLPWLTVEAVPAYNVEPERLGMHPQENGWLGYVVAIDGEPTRYYVSGDTDQNPDNEVVSCDVALVPIGGTYTLRPRAVVPTHYGSIVGTYANFDAFAAEVDPSIQVVRRLER